MGRMLFFGQVICGFTFFGILAIITHCVPISSLLIYIMPGKKGASGGWRPGAGRKPGATAIKKKGKGKATKKAKAADPEPSTASAKFLAMFVVKKAAAAAAPNNVRGSTYPTVLGSCLGRGFGLLAAALTLCPFSLLLVLSALS